MGSGKLIRRAIAKYGVENFEKVILHIFDNEEEMNAKEKELVFLGESSYNLCDGGKGGFGYINANKLGGTLGLKHSDVTKQKLSIRTKQHQNKNPELKVKLKEWNILNGNPMSGRKHSEETKRKMAEARIKYHASKNFIA